MPLKLRCPFCHEYFEVSELHLRNGSFDCPECSRALTLDEIIRQTKNGIPRRSSDSNSELSKESRGKAYSAIHDEMVGTYLTFLDSIGESLGWGCFTLIALVVIIPLSLVVFGRSISGWYFLALFVLSRLADYVTTRIGLSLGATETNPYSEAKRLTNFWFPFFFTGIIFLVLTLLATSWGSYHLINIPVWVPWNNSDSNYDVNWVQVLVAIPILLRSLFSIAAAVNNSFVILVRGEGNPTLAAILSLLVIVGLLFGASKLTSHQVAAQLAVQSSLLRQAELKHQENLD